MRQKPIDFFPSDHQFIVRYTQLDAGSANLSPADERERDFDAYVEWKLSGVKRQTQDGFVSIVHRFFDDAIRTAASFPIDHKRWRAVKNAGLSASLSLLLFCVLGAMSQIDFNTLAASKIADVHSTHRRLTALLSANHFAQESVLGTNSSKLQWQTMLLQTSESSNYLFSSLDLLGAATAESALAPGTCDFNCTYSVVNETMPFGSIYQSMLQTMSLSRLIALERNASLITPENPNFLEFWRINHLHTAPALSSLLAELMRLVKQTINWMDFFMASLVAMCFTVALLNLWVIRASSSMYGSESSQAIITLLTILRQPMADLEYSLTGKRVQLAAHDQ